jgi:hypothetical protein
VSIRAEFVHLVVWLSAYNFSMPLPPIVCSKCGLENPVTVRFCRRCHTPTRYECPACHHLQMQGGSCEECGTDFAKYAAMLITQAESHSQLQRDSRTQKTSLASHVLLLPITSIYALYKMLLNLRNGD